MKNEKTCSVAGCRAAYDSRGYCVSHRQKALKDGFIQKLAPTTLDERFWAKVDKSGTCWTWTGAIKSNGYGHLRANGKTVLAHRLSFEMANGAIPAGRMIDHRCHNRRCVNPAHLRLATMKQNQENQGGARKDSQTGIRGVHLKGRRLVASVMHNGQYVHVGSFGDLHQAEAAVIAKRKELFTHNERDRGAA